MVCATYHSERRPAGAGANIRECRKGGPGKRVHGENRTETEEAHIGCQRLHVAAPEQTRREGPKQPRRALQMVRSTIWSILCDSGQSGCEKRLFGRVEQPRDSVVL